MFSLKLAITEALDNRWYFLGAQADAHYSLGIPANILKGRYFTAVVIFLSEIIEGQSFAKFQSILDPMLLRHLLINMIDHVNIPMFSNVAKDRVKIRSR